MPTNWRRTVSSGVPQDSTAPNSIIRLSSTNRKLTTARVVAMGTEHMKAGRREEFVVEALWWQHFDVTVFDGFEWDTYCERQNYIRQDFFR